MQSQFLTANPETQKILSQAEKVARVDSSVLLSGESGTGKELLARHIHECSKRKDKPFVVLNCASVPSSLLESELFGHEVGAFTGATDQRIGIFEYASEGTIFLDEIGDIPLQVQVKLLRALQENEIKRIGSNKSIKVNPRIISATSYDLSDRMEAREFRDDFYFRLAVVTLKIPPLRERPEDIELLLNYFVKQYGKEQGKKNLHFSPEAKKLLMDYSWNGNVRELANVIERAVIMADDCIEKKHLGLNPIDLSILDEATCSLREISLRAAQMAEIDLITKILMLTAGNKSEAARIMGVSYRTLLNKIKEYRL